jgi:hypothetical protein
MEKAKRFSYFKTGLFVIAAIFFTVSACNKDDSNNNDTVIFTAELSGANEVPANPSQATGKSTLTFNQTTNTFNIVTTYSGGLTATGAHIHKGAPGVSGPIVFPFTPITSPINYTSPALDSLQKADLFAGNYYVNVHSALYPGGEIRGQLTKQ